VRGSRSFCLVAGHFCKLVLLLFVHELVSLVEVDLHHAVVADDEVWFCSLAFESAFESLGLELVDDEIFTEIVLEGNYSKIRRQAGNCDVVILLGDLHCCGLEHGEAFLLWG